MTGQKLSTKAICQNGRINQGVFRVKHYVWLSGFDCNNESKCNFKVPANTWDIPNQIWQGRINHKQAAGLVANKIKPKPR